jgi:hypothetical protein
LEQRDFQRNNFKCAEENDIIVMQDEPERIPEIFKSYQEKNAVDLEFKTRVMERLKQIEYSSVSSIRDLGEYLKKIAEDRALPAADVELQFYRIDLAKKLRNISSE